MGLHEKVLQILYMAAIKVKVAEKDFNKYQDNHALKEHLERKMLDICIISSQIGTGV